jgi:capsular exopolysaccharide synthesis family protein
MDSRYKKNDGGSPGANYGYRSGGSYGYGGYGGYGYGYGYGYPGYGGGAGETMVQRTFQDYVLILRERIWYILATFLVVFATTLVVTFSLVPVYRSTSKVEVFRRNPMVMQVQQVMDSEIRSAEDLNTQVNILKSDSIAQRVAQRLSGEDLRRFLAPYEKAGKPAPNMEAILIKNRDIAPERLSLIIDISYDHPDRDVAAEVANFFADEYIAYNAHMLVDESIKAVDELEKRANEQRKTVDNIAAALQAYREKNNSVSLDQRKDIVTEKLKGLNVYVTQNAAALQEAETRWKQVLACKEHGEDLLTLSFIAAVPAVSQLQQQVATSKITVAQLSRRYRAKHPAMLQALNSLTEAQNQLQRAIETSTAQVETEYQTALQNYAKAQAALAEQENDSLKLDRFGLEYTTLERDYEVNEKLLEQILGRSRETSMSSAVENENARIVDRAAATNRPISPNFKLNLSLGAVGGLGLGLALAFFAAYIDDRVKSAFDIETVVGLSLIGIVPEIKRLGKAENMESAVASAENQEVTEAFSTILSALKLKDESKNAQCILTTSTVAGEGKTFISTHLASAFASHGERVIVVDCDLRRPAVNRVFHLENLKGVIDICTAGAKIEDVVVKNVRPNLDILPTGGRSKNPTQTLNGKEFAQMISELRKRYDRIFIDTPPVAIVSDAFIVMPLVDGWLYSIYFNKVRRKAAEYCAKRMLSINIPSFGAVLNGLTGGVGGYYYSHYYAKSYKDYYVTRAEEINGAGAKITEPGQKRRKGQDSPAR